MTIRQRGSRPKMADLIARGAQFMELHDRGHSARDIASLCQVKVSLVYATLRLYRQRAGIASPTRSADDLRGAQFMKLRNEGRSVREIASNFNVHETTVYNALRVYRHHAGIAPPVRTVDQLRGAQFMKLRSEGRSVREIARLCHVHESTVYSALQVYRRHTGVPLPPLPARPAKDLRGAQYIKYLKAGQSLKAVADAHGVSKQSVSASVKKYLERAEVPYDPSILAHQLKGEQYVGWLRLGWSVTDIAHAYRTGLQAVRKSIKVYKKRVAKERKQRKRAKKRR